MHMENKKRKILVVDDDPGINESIQYILEDEGYEVLTTLDSTKVTVMLKQKPDLILLDIWMPGINGSDVCKSLKAESATKHIPVIMISATQDTKAIAMEAGANAFIIKPFEMQELLTKVAKFIR